MAIEIQLEKLRVAEAMSARDVLVQKLSDAYTSIREKTETIERLQQAINATANNGNVMSKVTSPSSALSQETPDQTTEIIELRSQVANLEALVQNLRIGSRNAIGPPPKYEEEERRVSVRPMSPHIRILTRDFCFRTLHLRTILPCPFSTFKLHLLQTYKSSRLLSAKKG